MPGGDPIPSSHMSCGGRAHERKPIDELCNRWPFVSFLVGCCQPVGIGPFLLLPSLSSFLIQCGYVIKHEHPGSRVPSRLEGKERNRSAVRVPCIYSYLTSPSFHQESPAQGWTKGTAEYIHAYRAPKSVIWGRLIGSVGVPAGTAWLWDEGKLGRSCLLKSLGRIWSSAHVLPPNLTATVLYPQVPTRLIKGSLDPSLVCGLGNVHLK